MKPTQRSPRLQPCCGGRWDCHQWRWVLPAGVVRQCLSTGSIPAALAWLNGCRQHLPLAILLLPSLTFTRYFN